MLRGVAAGVAPALAACTAPVALPVRGRVQWNPDGVSLSASPTPVSLPGTVTVSLRNHSNHETGVSAAMWSLFHRGRGGWRLVATGNGAIQVCRVWLLASGDRQTWTLHLTRDGVAGEFPAEAGDVNADTGPLRAGEYAFAVPAGEEAGCAEWVATRFAVGHGRR